MWGNHWYCLGLYILRIKDFIQNVIYYKLPIIHNITSTHILREVITSFWLYTAVNDDTYVCLFLLISAYFWFSNHLLLLFKQLLFVLCEKCSNNSIDVICPSLERNGSDVICPSVERNGSDVICLPYLHLHTLTLFTARAWYYLLFLYPSYVNNGCDVMQFSPMSTSTVQPSNRGIVINQAFTWSPWTSMR